ncbi:MAG: hypothetical protein P4M11_00195 [Candidatus Pacebacteria bacterium]|nr:hypothetical protein [Candidatus Paceibacterota bacterium]
MADRLPFSAATSLTPMYLPIETLAREESTHGKKQLQVLFANKVNRLLEVVGEAGTESVTKSYTQEN